MRDDVGGEDRHESVDELRARPAALDPRHPGREPPRSARRAAIATSSPGEKPSSSAVAGPKPRPPKTSCRLGRRSLNSGPSLAPSNVVDADPGEDQRGGPGEPSIRPAPTTGGRAKSAPRAGRQGE